jgi:predicted transcriptional regulator
LKEVQPIILSTPCEIAVKKYVPSIRASIAIVMVKYYGLSIYRAAKLLNLTPAAVSNYLLKRRGSDYVDLILGDKELQEAVIDLAGRIVDGSIDGAEVSAKLCEICRKLRERVEKTQVECGGGPAARVA